MLSSTSVVLSTSTPFIGPQSCVPGALMCRGDDYFAICDNNNSPIWSPVAQGTRCLCSTPPCVIAAAGTQSVQVVQAVEVDHISSSAAPISSTSAEAQENQVKGNQESIQGRPYVRVFRGDGSPQANWPTVKEWISFDSMWDSNVPIMSQACANAASRQPNNSIEEMNVLRNAILSAASSLDIDARFILAVVLQESNGCVRAATTSYSVNNPGLMQSHNGPFSCFNVNPCPATSIQGMIQDGSNGTPSGDGLKQCLMQSGSSDGRYYRAARRYNSGSIDPSGILEAGGATKCYASDIANRLIGWSVGNTGCHIS